MKKINRIMILGMFATILTQIAEYLVNAVNACSITYGNEVPVPECLKKKD